MSMSIELSNKIQAETVVNLALCLAVHCIVDFICVEKALCYTVTEKIYSSAMVLCLKSQVLFTTSLMF